MDRDDLQTLYSEIRQINKHLKDIFSVLIVIAIFTALAGRGAVLEHGLRKILFG